MKRLCLGIAMLAAGPAVAKNVITRDAGGGYACVSDTGEVRSYYLPRGAVPNQAWVAKCKADGGKVRAPTKPTKKAPSKPERAPAK